MDLNKIILKFNKCKYLSEFLTQGSLNQLAKFLTIGFLSFGTEFAILFVLTEYAKLWYIISNSAAFLISFWLNFYLNRQWSFKSSGRLNKQLTLYSMLFCINLLISSILMYTFTNVLGLNYLVSKVFVTGTIFLWNFVIYKKVIYR